MLATGRRGIAAVAECRNVNLKLGGIGMPDVTAWFFETMLGAEVTRSVYPPGTLYPGQQRITMRLGGHKVLIAPPHPHELNVSAPQSPSLRAGAYRLTVDDVDASVEELRAKGTEIAIGPLTRNPVYDRLLCVGREASRSVPASAAMEGIRARVVPGRTSASRPR